MDSLKQVLAQTLSLGRISQSDGSLDGSQVRVHLSRPDQVLSWACSSKFRPRGITENLWFALLLSAPMTLVVQGLVSGTPGSERQPSSPERSPGRSPVRSSPSMESPTNGVGGVSTRPDSPESSRDPSGSLRPRIRTASMRMSTPHETMPTIIGERWGPNRS